MYEKILVPLDGSRAAEIVLPYAEEIAARFEGELILVSVYEPTAAEAAHLYRSYLERIVDQVQGQIKEWGAKKEARVASDLLMGKPATQILRYADESSVSLIVMASHGSSGEGPWLLGNIASKVLQAADKPVILIKVPANSAALQQKTLVKRILVPLDGSEMGGAAIPHVEALARVLGAEVILFHVPEPPPVIIAPGISVFYMPVPPEEEARRTASALEYLGGVEQALKDKGLSASSEVSPGSPADEIIEFAEANAVDVIAMSTHGRSGIKRWVFGSVTDRVLHAAKTAVLTVRATKQ